MTACRVTTSAGRVLVGVLGDKAPVDLTPDEARRTATALLEAASAAEAPERPDWP